MNKVFKNILVYGLGLFLILGLLSAFNVNNKPAEITAAEFVQLIESGKVQQVNTVGATKVEVQLSDKSVKVFQKDPNESISSLLDNLAVDTTKTKAILGTSKPDTSFWAMFGGILTFILPTFLILIFLFFMLRQAQSGNNKALTFGKTRAKQFQVDEDTKTSFKDVAGVHNAKQELEEVVEFLKHPKKFTDLGAKIPKGVLLVGSPGTGKTLLAKAVAGEAGVPFFSLSGSEFVEMFVGVGASRVRDLFQKAKLSAPCIIFIDEIDAVGRQRGAGLGGSHDEREQTLNQILVEMDGFEDGSSVIVIAATNRPDILDPALLRPGRFDRRVILDKPDLKERRQILDVHVKNKPLAKDVDLDIVASRTPGLTGADLSNLMNEAAIRTARFNRKKITQEDILESIEKVLIGPERKNHILSDEERKITAYHEAGHAIIGHFLPNCDPVHKISIISRGRAAGYTLNLPDNDSYLSGKAKFIDNIAMILGGYIVEKEVFGNLTTGPSNDLQKVTAIAKGMVTRYAMSDALPPRTYGEHDEMVFLGKDVHKEKDYSEKISQIIDKEIEKIINEGLNKGKALIQEKRKALDALAQELLEKETIEKEDFEKMMEKFN